jgi:hypothetical protein
MAEEYIARLDSILDRIASSLNLPEPPVKGFDGGGHVFS